MFGKKKKYEGKEHVKYKDPGYSRHKIEYPEDEPKMRSRVSREEMHEVGDNFHMDVPDQTEDSLPAKLKRAKMKMDAPDQEDPKPLRGNLVTEVPEEGIEDEDGEDDEGPNEMQKDIKNNRKKLIVAVVKKKMGKKSY